MKTRRFFAALLAVVVVSFITLPANSQQKATIVLIVNNCGYDSGPLLQHFLNLPAKITFGVVPNPWQGRQVAERIRQAGKEVIINLPMEAMSRQVDDENYTLFVRQTDRQIQARAQKAINDFPEAKGLNNNQGSLATSNARVMTALMRVLDKNGLYFVDCRTHKTTVAGSIAKAIGVPFASSRKCFDHNTRSSAEVKDNLLSLANIAVREGLVVCIGHFRSETCDGLKQALPTLKRQGVQIVFGSEVIK